MSNKTIVSIVFTTIAISGVLLYHNMTRNDGPNSSTNQAPISVTTQLKTREPTMNKQGRLRSFPHRPQRIALQKSRRAPQQNKIYSPGQPIPMIPTPNCRGSCAIRFARKYYAYADKRCGWSRCFTRGLCHYNVERSSCVARSERDCRYTTDCARYGRCSFLRGACRVGKNRDCQRSFLCRSKHLCKFYKGHCVPHDTAACQKRWDCRHNGLCTWRENTCVAGKDEDCKHSKRCRSRGECTARGGVCIAGSDADCQESKLCQVKGFCIASDNGKCRPSTLDCHASLGCRKFGLCTRKNNTCVIGKRQDCLHSEICKKEGACSFVPERSNLRCVAALNTDCARSSVCLMKGFCVAHQGACYPSGSSSAACAAKPTCKARGWCSSVQGACVIASKTDCARTSGCKQYGSCDIRKRMQHGYSRFYCTATNDKHCQQSKRCRKTGKKCSYMPFYQMCF